MKVLGWITFLLISVVLSNILSGYVLSILWGWFITPTFGLPLLSIPIAIGLSLVIRYLTQDYNNTKNKDESFAYSLCKALIYSTIKPLFALLMGWVVKLFI